VKNNFSDLLKEFNELKQNVLRPVHTVRKVGPLAISSAVAQFYKLTQVREQTSAVCVVKKLDLDLLHREVATMKSLIPPLLAGSVCAHRSLWKSKKG
jgi:hypothetical protein